MELRGLLSCVWPQHSREYFSLDSDKLNPEIIRKTYPRPIQAFIKAVERKDRELGGTMGLTVKGLRASDPSGVEPIILLLLLLLLLLILGLCNSVSTEQILQFGMTG